MKVRTLGFIVVRNGQPLALHTATGASTLTYSEKTPWATFFPSYLQAWRAIERTLALDTRERSAATTRKAARKEFRIIRVVGNPSARDRLTRLLLETKFGRAA